MKQFHIFFWEGLLSRVTNKAGFVVEKHSAAPIIDNTERSGIHTTHLQMIWFSTSEMVRLIVTMNVECSPIKVNFRASHARALASAAAACC
jgi:hypothetical protein